MTQDYNDTPVDQQNDPEQDYGKFSVTTGAFTFTAETFAEVVGGAALEVFAGITPSLAVTGSVYINFACAGNCSITGAWFNKAMTAVVSTPQAVNIAVDSADYSAISANATGVTTTATLLSVDDIDTAIKNKKKRLKGAAHVSLIKGATTEITNKKNGYTDLEKKVTDTLDAIKDKVQEKYTNSGKYINDRAALETAVQESMTTVKQQCLKKMSTSDITTLVTGLIQIG